MEECLKLSGSYEKELLHPISILSDLLLKKTGFPIGLNVTPLMLFYFSIRKEKSLDPLVLGNLSVVLSRCL